MEKFTIIALDNYYNSSCVEPYPKVSNKPRWDTGTLNALSRLGLAQLRSQMRHQEMFP